MKREALRTAIILAVIAIAVYTAVYFACKWLFFEIQSQIVLDMAEQIKNGE